MNLNRKQFLAALRAGQVLLEELQGDYPELKLYPVLSRFGPRSGQCDLTTDLKKIVMGFPEMLAAVSVGHERAHNLQRGNVPSGRVQSVLGEPAPPENLRDLLFEIRAAEKDGDKEQVSSLWKQVNEIEQKLLDPELKLYCGDVLIEFRPGVLKYEPLRRLQQDPLTQGLGAVRNCQQAPPGAKTARFDPVEKIGADLKVFRSTNLKVEDAFFPLNCDAQRHDGAEVVAQPNPVEHKHNIIGFTQIPASQLLNATLAFLLPQLTDFGVTRAGCALEHARLLAGGHTGHKRPKAWHRAGHRGSGQPHRS